VTAASRRVVAILAVTLAAGAAGGWLGVRYGLEQARSRDTLDELIHHELRLSTDQQHQLATLNQRFRARRAILEDEMRAANRELATAISREHLYGPEAERAIEHFHTAMQTLQAETIQHVLAMRAVLTPEQASQFDRTLAKALNSDRP